MNSAIEVHDSWIAGITPHNESLIVQFSPAYIHRSVGEPGFDPGTVWMQNLRLVISESKLELCLIQWPQQLSEGLFCVNGKVFENIVPLPLNASGTVCFSAVCVCGERLVIQGKRATVTPIGEARYLEAFTRN